MLELSASEARRQPGAGRRGGAPPVRMSGREVEECTRMLQQTNYTDPDSRVPGDVGNRQWFYQTCTQFGWYQSSDQTGG